MTAYWINTFTRITDEATLARYVEFAGPAVRASGGSRVASNRQGPGRVLSDVDPGPGYGWVVAAA